MAREARMDTEAIASEIVDLKNRIVEMDADVENDNEEERKDLHERMRRLQDRLADKGEAEKIDPDDRAVKDQFIAPA